MSYKVNILYISTLCSPSLANYLFNTSVKRPVQSAQKFHQLLVVGLSLHDECQVKTLSSIPVIASSHKKRFWNVKSEKIDRIEYNYIPFINLAIFKEISIFIFTILKMIIWSLRYKRKNRVIICDILGLSTTIGALVISKLTHTKIISIFTDLPGLMVPNEKSNKLKTKMYIRLSNTLFAKFDGYILLTEQMNKVINIHNRPFIIMEGLVDIKMSSCENHIINKSSERILIYAGGILEQYGIKKLIEAFMKLEDADLRLDIYGSGDMEKDMPAYMELDPRIRYKGVVINKDVVKRQIEATLLINPRPSHEEFTKYSFPSKNMEYMASGTPLLTTPLAGMPKEYNQFVYLFNNESIDGIYITLKEILIKPKVELHYFGLEAKQFVLANKNNYKQAGRIMEYLKYI